jgi:hypothetical protein
VPPDPFAEELRARPSPAELIVYRFAAARLTEKLFFITAVRVVAEGT